MSKKGDISLQHKLRTKADWGRHTSQIRNQLRWQIEPSDLDDAVNETVLTFFLNTDNFDATRSRYDNLDDQIGAYLRKTTHFAGMKFRRRQYRLNNLFHPLTEEPPDLTESDLLTEQAPPLDADDIQELLTRALENCGPALCEVADLHFQGKEPGEIAEMLDLEPNQVYKRLQQLHKKLQAARSESTREAVTQLVYRSRTTLTELLLGREEKPLPLPGCGYGDKNSLENYEQIIDRLTNLEEGDRLTLKQARRELEGIEGRDEFDKAYACDKLIDITYELTLEKPRPSLLQQFLSNLAELTPSIAHLLSSLASLTTILK